MSNNPSTALSQQGRAAMARRDWQHVQACAAQILKADEQNPEGLFLDGMAHRAANRIKLAARQFQSALEADPGRYDAAVELAEIRRLQLRHGEAKRLLDVNVENMQQSPLYLNKAGMIYEALALEGDAWQLYQRAIELQPEADVIKGNLASCATKVGELDIAKTQYRALLDKYPAHQRNHYELARLNAGDETHLDQMQRLLAQSTETDERNIFLLFALAKSLEDQGQWEGAFAHYKRANDAAAGLAVQAGYKVDTDVQVMQTVIEQCTPEWLNSEKNTESGGAIPIFIVGLPRTGTTLSERILASHSQVETAGESFFLELAVKNAAGLSPRQDINAEAMSRALDANASKIAQDYMNAIEYRLSRQPYFIEKYPFNYLYIGLVAKALPQAKFVFLERAAMDACFSTYKQPYFKFSFKLDWLADYYRAFDRLRAHWKSVLGERMVHIRYEDIVYNTQASVRNMLGGLGLAFEPQCLEFHTLKAASATASSVQIREKIYDRSINKWTRWRGELAAIERALQKAGLNTDPVISPQQEPT